MCNAMPFGVRACVCVFVKGRGCGKGREMGRWV